MMRRYVIYAAMSLGLLPAAVMADDTLAARDDVMMSVVGAEDADEQSFVEEIRLPGATARKGEDNAAAGSETAHQAQDGDRSPKAREPGRPPQHTGRQRAAEARESAREAREMGQRQAAEARNSAREARRDVRRQRNPEHGPGGNPGHGPGGNPNKGGH